MEVIRADVDGLSAVAATCETHSGVLAASSGQAPSVGAPPTPTGAAVQAAHTAVGETAQRFSGRMQYNAERFWSAAAGFASVDGDASYALITLTGLT